jgi:TPP-dependent pyruvate/acetoin dehydrogenase alpha subunit
MTREAVERARKGGGPTSLEFKCLRFFGHYEGDPQKYRAAGEVEDARINLDAITNFRERVAKDGLLEVGELDAIDERVGLLIDESVVEAIAAPTPSPDAVTEDVYISY